MIASLASRRLLLAADPDVLPLYLERLADDGLPDWDVVGCTTFEQARFLSQHRPMDVFVVDESFYLRVEMEGLAHLARGMDAGLLLLTEPSRPFVAAALEHGTDLWLPRSLALHDSAFLSAAIARVLRVVESRQRCCHLMDMLRDCRQHANRLLRMLWDARPVESRTGLLTQRHALDRLRQEVLRAERYGSPLSVVLTEFDAGGSDAGAESEESHAGLFSWAAERVTRANRYCDVTGRYGARGILVLLTQTDEKGAVRYCRRMRELLLDRDQSTPREPAGLKAYFGFADMSPGLRSPQSLLCRAEQRLEEDRERTDPARRA